MTIFLQNLEKKSSLDASLYKRCFHTLRMVSMTMATAIHLANSQSW